MLSIDESGLNNELIKKYGWYLKNCGVPKIYIDKSIKNKSLLLCISYKYGLISC